MGFKRKQMQALTLHIELFVHHSLLFRLYNLLCRTAQHAHPFVPKVNLICTNIFMCKVLRKNNFSSNHSTSKNLIANIQQIISKCKREGGRLHPIHAKAMDWFYAPFYKTVCIFIIKYKSNESLTRKPEPESTVN